MSAVSDPLRLGLIGAGPWGRNYIRTIAATPGLALTRLASRNPESPALAGPDCAVDADWRALIGAGGMDGVIVATPPKTHAEIALAAIDAGLAVLVEKPMTLDVAEAETLARRAEDAGAIVRVNHIHLYSAAWEALRERTGALGHPRAITAEAGNWGVFRPDCSVLWDWGSHYVAMCIDLMGGLPDGARARRLETRQTDAGAGEIIAFELEFGAVTASVRIGNLFAEKTRLFVVAFEDAALVYDDTIDDKLRQGPSPTDATDTIPVGPGVPLERAVLSFADAIAHGGPDWSDARLGADVVRILADLDSTLR